jgi:hypothetical protein
VVLKTIYSNLKIKKMDTQILIEILEESVKKNGEKPLTNKWLLNILKLVEKKQEKEEEERLSFDPTWD